MIDEGLREDEEVRENEGLREDEELDEGFRKFEKIKQR